MGRPSGGNGNPWDGEQPPEWWGKSPPAWWKRPEPCEVPSAVVDGKPNVEYYRARLQNATQDAEWHMRQHGDVPKGHDSLMRSIERMAERHFGKPAKELSLYDNRPDADKNAETWAEMKSSDGEAVLEKVEDLVSSLERMVAAAVNGCQAEQERRREAVEQQASDLRLGKRWLESLSRVRRLRECVRTKGPPLNAPRLRDRKTWPAMNPWNKHAWEAAYPLIVLVVIYRTDISDDSERGGVFNIAQLHCKIAVDIWEGRRAALYYAEGTKEECKRWPQIFKDQGGWRFGQFECKGIFIQTPPRHGKTSIGAADMAAGIFQNPRRQRMIVHQQDDLAAKNLQMVSSVFRTDNAAGRRAMSIFGYRLDKQDNNRWSMRLVQDNRTKEPTLRAKAVKGSFGGGNTDDQWWDDPVKKEEAEQAEVRLLTHKKLSQDVMRRNQGKNSWLTATFTTWHDDDAMATFVRQAQKGEIPYKVSIQRCGGPEGTWNPATGAYEGESFRPLCPSLVPRSELIRAFKEMNDRQAYSAQFECRPTPDSARTIKKLRYYLASIGTCRKPSKEHFDLLAQHRRFASGAAHHLSIDPAVTPESESTRTTDQSGQVYAACGDLTFETEKDGQKFVESRRIIRVIDADQFYADPNQAVESVGQYAAGRRVDRVHLENVGFSIAIAQMLIAKYDLPPSSVVTHKTANKSKAYRLRAVSPMLDDSIGLAVIEFPGTLDDDGNLIPDPRLAWLYRQILQFGSVKEDHVVDAITQLCKYLAGDVDIGQGAVGKAVVKAAAFDPDQERRRKMLAEYDLLANPRERSPESVDMMCA